MSRSPARRLPCEDGAVRIAAGGSNPTQAQISFDDAQISENFDSHRGIEKSAENQCLRGGSKILITKNENTAIEDVKAHFLRKLNLEVPK